MQDAGTASVATGRSGPRRSISLQWRLVALIGALVVGTAAVMAALVYRDFGAAIYEQQLREMQRVNGVAASRLVQVAHSIEQTLAAFTRKAALRGRLADWLQSADADAEQHVYAEIADLMAADPAYSKVQVYDVTGVPKLGLVRSGDRLERHVDAAPGYLDASEALEQARRTPIGIVRVIGPLVEPGHAAALHLDIGAPVFSQTGTRIGVIFAQYDVQPVLTEVQAETLQRFRSDAATAVALIDLGGRVAGNSGGVALARQAPAILRALDAAPGKAYAGTFEVGGEPYGLAAQALTYSAGSPARFSLLVIAAPRSQLLYEARQVFYGSLAAIGLMLALAIALAVMFARSLTRPLERLLAATVSFGEHQRVERLPTGRHDEVGRLALAFERMMGQVAERKAALEREVAERERAEAALQEKAQHLEASRQQYRSLYESVAAGVGVLGPQGRFLTANPTLVELLGYESEAELALVDYDAGIWVGPGEAQEFARRVRQEGEITGVEVQLRRRDGGILWAVQNVRAVWDAAGEVCAYEATVLDITDRKQAEYAQRASELRFRRLFDSNMIGIVFGKGASGLLTDANAYALSLLGYDPRDLPVPIAEVLTRDSHELAARLRHDGVLRQAQAPLELEFRRRDGVAVPVLVNVALLDSHRDDFVAIVLDRRVAVEAEQRAEAITAFYEFVFEEMPTAVVYLDAELRVGFVNGALSKAFGVPAEDCRGRRVADLLGASAFQRYESRMRQALAGETVHFTDHAGEHGRERHSDTYYLPRREADGRVAGFLVLMHDLTDQMQLESRLRQSQKIEALGKLTGGIAHDFNNLLSVIIGNLQLLDRQLAREPRATRPLGAALRAATRGVELTRRLLTFSRQQPLEPRVLDLGEQLSGMHELLARTLGEPIHIVMRLAPGTWPVKLDPGQFENALLNLAINARDAMPGGGTLTFATANTMLGPEQLEGSESGAPGEYLHLQVSDTGVGMSAEVLARAFEPFFTTKSASRGSGLGLSMVYGFVQQSGGVARLDSQPGSGTTVDLYFPRSAELATAIAATATGSLPVLPTGTETVLVVEDDPDVRETAVAILTDLGYTVVEAADGPQAVEQLQRNRQIAIVFSDVVMPGGMYGPQVVDAARALRPGIAALLTSGFTDGALVQRAGASGETLLWKPYSPGDLALRIRAALDDRPDSGRRAASSV